MSGWRGGLKRYGVPTAAVLVFTGCLVLSFHKIRQEHELELVDAGMSLWLATQADYELQRLRHTLDAYALGKPGVDHDAVEERFEIFWSRLPLLVEGPDSSTVRAASDAGRVAPEIIGRLRQLEADLTALRPGDGARYARLSDTLASFVGPLHRVVVSVEHSLGQTSQRRFVARNRLYLEQAAYLIGILASGGILIALLFRETARTRRLLAEATATQDRVWHLAHHDPVTELPNRWLFEDRLEQALRRAQRDAELVALHYLDLDHFKAINDGFGHVVGDRLLAAAGDRLRLCLRDSDTLARLGGDEFAVIQTGLPDESGAALLAERLVDALRTPVMVDGHALRASVSIGVGLYPEHAALPAELQQAADRALYRAKAEGRDRWHLYDASLAGEAAPQRRAMAG